MKIKELLARGESKPVALAPHHTIQEAIRGLCRHHVGAAVVLDEEGSLVGLVASRDVLLDCGFKCSELKRLANPDRVVCPRLVEDVMSTEVIVGAPGYEVEHALGLMARHHVDFLPILEGDRVIGLVSLGDVLRAHMQITAAENRLLRDYIRGAS